VVNTQITLESSVFGEGLQERVTRAEAIIDEATDLLQTLNEECEGEWQPAAIDQAIHYAVLAVENAGNEQYHDYLNLAEEALAAAEWAFGNHICEYSPR